MLSVNHSVDELNSYFPQRPKAKPAQPAHLMQLVEDLTSPYPQRTSINPNLSLTNIMQLNHPKAFKTPRSLQAITPPTSNSPTPVADRKGVFQFGSYASSTTSLDQLADAEPAVQQQTVRVSRFLPRVNIHVFLLCVLWYGFSIVSSNSTKAILSQFPYPVTLTQCQFILNAVLCTVLFGALLVRPNYTRHFPKGSIPNLHALEHSMRRFLTPTPFIVATTLPMGIFQFLGHISSHKATTVIPVSLVHTIKALSPITTVFIYRVVYRVQFPLVTYLSLLPLVLGIMLTCYKPRKAAASYGDSYVSGLIYAFISMVIFVSQNIFAKKRLTYDSPAESTGSELPSYKRTEEKKLDKLTILLFCSVIGFLFTLPVYVLSEYQNGSFSLSQMTASISCLVVLNGVSHFMQSLLAFSLLGTVSPINYSIANIMKRIAVILFAFMWESSFSFSGTQSYGIVLTVAGLYCYDRWGLARKK